MFVVRLNMKRSLIAIFCLAIIIGSLSCFDFTYANELAETDKFNVINVQGKIIVANTGNEMKRGDIYVEGTRLNFTTSSSRAAIVNSSKGRFVLTGSSKGKVKVLPATNNISSRSGALLNIVDLKNHFSDRYLILKNSEVQIGKAAFPMGNQEFFYLTYEYNGEKIAKKLRNEDDFLILNKEEIYKIDGKAIPYEEKEMTLYYKKDGKGIKINTFTPVFANNENLVAEVNILLDSFSDASNEEKIKEVVSYLNEFYGNPHKENLKAWLKAEFNLE